MKLVDIKGRIVEIEMFGKNGIDFSEDFFETGGLEYDEEKDAYKVDDVEYCICQAKDCRDAEGDYYVPEEDRKNYDTVDIWFEKVNF